ncbi:MAG: hypothetical protein K9M44_02030 [Candidatus Pacebacteria bacterium]|nr:hypothetical protein [Candidatus Paceibacterota bacterium]
MGFGTITLPPSKRSGSNSKEQAQKRREARLAEIRSQSNSAMQSRQQSGFRGALASNSTGASAARAFDGGVDEGLLNNSQSESAKAAELKKDKQNDATGGVESSGNIKKDQQASRKKSKFAQAKASIKKKLNVGKMATAGALRFSWQYVWVFGLTLIYINAHAFLRIILPWAFCRLGEEWTMEEPGGAQVFDQKAEKKLNKYLVILEPIGLLFANIAMIMIILTILYLYELLTDMVTNPLNYLANLGETYVNAIVKGLGMD